MVRTPPAPIGLQDTEGIHQDLAIFRWELDGMLAGRLGVEFAFPTNPTLLGEQTSPHIARVRADLPLMHTLLGAKRSLGWWALFTTITTAR